MARGRLSIAKSLRRPGARCSLVDPRYASRRSDELPELGMGTRQVEQVRRGVHQRLGLSEHVDSVFEAALFERRRPFGRQRTGACALLVGLSECWHRRCA